MNSSLDRKRLIGIALIALGIVALGVVNWFVGQLSRGRPEDLKHFRGQIVYREGTHDTERYHLYLGGSEALKRGDADGAEKIYRSIVAKYPEEANSYEALGACLYCRTNYPEARTQYLHALKIDPRSADALYGIGSVAYSQRSNDEAVAYFQKALSISGPDAKSHRVLGLVYVQMGETSNAVFHLRKAIELDHSVGDEPEIRDLLKSLEVRRFQTE
jgi:Flp pilus assembly protein TadD